MDPFLQASSLHNNGLLAHLVVTGPAAPISADYCTANSREAATWAAHKQE